MSDIVKWLRGMGEFTRKATTNGYRYDEAADEIERLRSELAQWREIWINDGKEGKP